MLLDWIPVESWLCAIRLQCLETVDIENVNVLLTLVTCHNDQCLHKQTRKCHTSNHDKLVVGVIDSLKRPLRRDTIIIRFASKY